MAEIIALAFLDVGAQRLIASGPGRVISFRAAGATITDERDMLPLLLSAGITVEVMPGWRDRLPDWIAACDPKPVLARVLDMPKQQHKKEAVAEAETIVKEAAKRPKTKRPKAKRQHRATKSAAKKPIIAEVREPNTLGE